MSILSRSTDTLYAYRVLRILTYKWEDMDAFKFGIIDDQGKLLRKSSTLTTSKEKASFTPLHRLIFNLKRLLEKVPFGKTRFANYAAALLLLREHTGEDISQAFLDEFSDIDEQLPMNEWFITESGISPGSYFLKEDMYIPEFDTFAKKGSTVVVENTKPEEVIHGVPVYKVKHNISKQSVYVSAQDLTK